MAVYTPLSGVQLAPGVVGVRGAGVTFSEWPTVVRGGIASCVETSAAIVLNLLQGRPLSRGEVTAMVNDLYARGQASGQGVTTWSAEAGQLNRLGISTEYVSHYDPHMIIRDLQRGRPVVLGFTQAHALRDDRSGRQYNRGIYGHSVTVEAYDAHGLWVADPNTPPGTGLLHYSWANLRAAGAQYMDVPR